MDIYFLISIFHIVCIVPFFAYIFIQKAATPDFVYNILFFLGLFVLVYHGYKSYIKYMSGSPYLWVNLYHLSAVAPLMIYIGYEGKKTPTPAYEGLGLMTFAALGYHLYHIVVLANVHSEND